MSKKIRLDKLIIQKNIISEKEILPFVMAGEIYVNGIKAHSIAQNIDIDSFIEIRKITKEYVSRGGYKLKKALEEFNIDVKNTTCVDFGSSTGGFSDVLLQNGVEKLFCVETGKNLLDQKIRNDKRVIVMEGISIFELDTFKDHIDYAVADISFIPLKNIISKIFAITNNAPLIALLKPHYEAADQSLLRNGVIKDNYTLQMVINNFKSWLTNNYYILEGMVESPIKGGGGNTEFLCFIKKLPN